MKNKINLPGFKAESSFNLDIKTYSVKTTDYFSKNVVTMQRMRLPGLFGRKSLSVGVFECSGSCPDGKLLCKSDINCVCCPDGCVDIIGGGVKCGTIS
jgi:hypothetical protein